MSVADKQILLSRINEKFGDEISANQRDKVMALISSELTNYEVDFYGSTNEDRTKEVLNEFISAKTIEGKSLKTVERYNYVLNKVFEYLSVPIDNINVFHIRNYISHMKKQGSCDVTLEGYRAIIVAFFKWCFNEGLLKPNNIVNFTAITCQNKVKYPFSEVDIELLKESTENDRDKCIICFLLSTGCRVSEMCALNASDIDFNENKCTVLGKGNKERLVFFDDYTALLLKRYLEARSDNSNALFTGKGTERIAPHGVRAMLKRLEEKTGVENVHPHRFRRTLATNLINRGMPIEQVAKILGHSKLETTLKYVYISDDKLKNNYNKYAS